MKRLLTVLLLFATCLAQAQPAYKPGMLYNYYEGDWPAMPDFLKLPVVKTGTVNNFLLNVAVNPVSYGLVFTGYIDIAVAGDYTFYTTSDDFSTLSIDYTRLVSGGYNTGEQKGVVTLQPGKHAIDVQYYQAKGDMFLTVQYEGPGITKQSIPDDKLFTLVVDLPPLNIPVASMLVVSDTTHFANDQLVYSRIFIVMGFIVYRDAKDPLNPGMVTFSYLDADKRELDNKYVVWLSKERHNATVR